MPIKFTEEQALRHLADDAWSRNGNVLVSNGSFSPEAIKQYGDALSNQTRDTIKFRTQPDRAEGALSSAKSIVLDARGAERLFAERGLSLNLGHQSPAALREF